MLGSWRIPLGIFALTVVIFALGQGFGNEPRGVLGPSIPMRIVSEGGDSFLGPENLEINNQVVWSRVWVNALCVPTYACSVPAVDFTNTTILAVFAGAEPFINYVVNVTQVRQAGSSVAVEATLWVPGNGCPAPIGAHSGAPYQIIAIAKTGPGATFSNRTVLVNCRP